MKVEQLVGPREEEEMEVDRATVLLSVRATLQCNAQSHQPPLFRNPAPAWGP